MNSDDLPEPLRSLKAALDRLDEEVRSQLPRLAEARRKYARSKTEADGLELDRVQAAASNMHKRYSELVRQMEEASGLPPEILKLLGEARVGAGHPDRTPRKELTADKVDPTGYIDEPLSKALDAILGLLPSDWLEAEDATPCRLNGLAEDDFCLSLVKGLRKESEAPGIHRMRQAVRVAQDYLSGHLWYDHFAGASLVPELTQLGLSLDHLDEVGGDVAGRLRSLWNGPSKDVDSTVFELLVAARCAEYGRSIEFITATQDKSPDLRCHDPFPMVIECKRRRPLSSYESAEEAVMRSIFAKLRLEAGRRGLCGRFSLRLNVEATQAPISDIVTSMVSLRLTRRPEIELHYPWGSVAFHERPRRLNLPGSTRVYSPDMLMTAFGWSTDLPKWDGIVCRIDNVRDPYIDRVINPLALVWTNTSSTAITKRAWSPVNLFGDATRQMPPGEFGIVYLAYYEGAREEIADRRVDGFKQRIAEWQHSADIRIPVAFLVRLYPRALGVGQPDLIESTMRFCSEAYGNPLLFEDFPSTVFTKDLT